MASDVTHCFGLYSFILFIFHSFLFLNSSQKRQEKFRKVPAWFVFRNIMNIFKKVFRDRQFEDKFPKGGKLDQANTKKNTKSLTDLFLQAISMEIH